jgi:rhomboid protease GluP
MAQHQRQSILCPNCRKLISISEPLCPYCGTARPASFWKNNIWTRGFNNPYQLIKAIIAINIGLYILSLLLNPTALSLSMHPLTFLSPSDTSLLLLGATGTIPIDRFHRWWTLISAGYLHGGILHIFFNMAAFRQLALLVSREYGPYRMVLFYTLGSIIGFWVSYIAGVPLTIGASAGVCGLVGALLYYGKSRGGVYGRTLYKQISGWVVFLFIFGLLVPGINNWGHGGGILAGIILGLLLGYQERKKENLLHKGLAGVCAVLTLLVLAWAILTAVIYRLFG